MQLFQNLLSKVRPHFEEGGKLEKFYYGYDALETFLFVPGHSTHKGETHIKDGIDLKRTMFVVVLAMGPCLAFGMWNVNGSHCSFGSTNWFGAEHLEGSRWCCLGCQI